MWERRWILSLRGKGLSFMVLGWNFCFRMGLKWWSLSFLWRVWRVTRVFFSDLRCRCRAVIFKWGFWIGKFTRNGYCWFYRIVFEVEFVL